MMMTEKMTYRWLWNCLIAGGLLLPTGCADDSTGPLPEPEEDNRLELSAVTRTTGATAMPDADQTIQVYLATEDSYQSGTFEHTAGGGWTTTGLTVKEEAPYYIYGYMPSTVIGTVSVGATDLGGDYSKGIDLTLSGLPCITTEDVCVIVGVQRVTSPTVSPDKPTVTEGSYGYRAGTKGQNYVNLLMAHLYSRLDMSFKIDPDYAELRSIHLKKVILTSKYGTAAVTVSIRDGVGIGSPAFPAASEENEGLPKTLFESSTTEPVVPEKVLDKALGGAEMALDIPAYLLPVTAAAGSNYNLTLTTTYDVWDRGSGQNLGERTSVNKITLNSSAVRPGNEQKLILTVKPTYLYILSDNDLDNPVIDVNAGGE